MSAAEMVHALRASHGFPALSLDEYLLLLEVRHAGLASLDRFFAGWVSRATVHRRDRMRLTTKSDLRDSFESFAAPEIDSMTLWWKTTSGTSGRPVNIPYDAAFYLDFKFGCFHKAWYMRRKERLDKQAYLALVITDIPDEAASISIDPLFSAGVVARLSIDVADRDQIQSVLRLIDSFRPKILSTKPSVLAALVSAGTKGQQHDCLVFVGGATLSPDLRLAATKMFGEDVVSVYAISEVGVVASECSMGRMHAYESDIDLTDSHELAPSEIVVTNQNNRAMPIVGYRTGDSGKLSSEPCACKSTWRWIERLDGRVVPLFRLSRGEVVSPTRFNGFIRAFPSVREFQATLHAGDALDVRVDCLQPPDADAIESMKAYFSKGLPDYVSLNLVEHTFDPNEKFSRFRVLE